MPFDRSTLPTFHNIQTNLNQLYKNHNLTSTIRLNEHGEFKVGKSNSWKYRTLCVLSKVMPFFKEKIQNKIYQLDIQTQQQQQNATQILHSILLTENPQTPLHDRSIVSLKDIATVMNTIKLNRKIDIDTWVIPPTIKNNKLTKEDAIKATHNLEIDYQCVNNDKESSSLLANNMKAAKNQQELSSTKEQKNHENALTPFDKCKQQLNSITLSDDLSTKNTQTQEKHSLRQGQYSLPNYQTYIHTDHVVDEPTLYNEPRDVSFHTESNNNSGVAHCTGKRTEMEDSVNCSEFSLQVHMSTVHVKCMGVFDGHSDQNGGGKDASDYMSKNFSSCLSQRLEEDCSKPWTDTYIYNAIKSACIDLSNEYSPKSRQEICGTTANVAIQIGRHLWVANVGDSRAVLVSNSGEVTQLSEDAKPSDPRYTDEIIARGGTVVNDKIKIKTDNQSTISIGVARGLGEHYSKGIISPVPNITKIERPEQGWNNYRLVQACDGLFDVANSDTVGQFVHQQSNHGASNAVIAGQLAKAAYDSGSTDNISVIVSSLS